MESQRAALKVFYQTQLDELVRSKVDEYQKQFDEMEKSIRKETKQNERMIAERALKQIELITQKYVDSFFFFYFNDHQVNVYRVNGFSEMNRNFYCWRKNTVKKWNCAKFGLEMPQKLSVNWNRSWVFIVQNGKHAESKHKIIQQKKVQTCEKQNKKTLLVAFFFS